MIYEYLPPCTPQTVLWYSTAIFFLGFFVGAAVVNHIHQKREKNIYVEVIRWFVIAIWIFATAKAALFDLEYPPFFLNLMFGVIAGGLNSDIWNKMVELTKVLRK